MASADADRSRSFDHIAPLDGAGPAAVSCAAGEEDRSALARTRAGACFIAPADLARLPAETTALLTDEPARAFAAIVAALYPDASRPSSFFATRGISPASFIHPEARLEEDVVVDPGVVIGPGAEIGSGTLIGANSVIGPQVRIGRNCAIGAHVTISGSLIGNDVVIHPGARLGQHSSPALHSALPLGIGRVIVQDGVEIGANATIDRGALADTILGERCRVDNLVRVPSGHTVARHGIWPRAEA